MFERLINNSQNKRLLVIGDIMLDHYIIGKVNRISPEAPVPILDVISENNTLGGCGNVINNLFNLGINIDVISIIGNDEAGENIMQKLNDINVDTKNMLVKDNIKTTLKTRIIAENHQILRVDWNTKTINSSEENIIIKKIEEMSSKIDAVIISDYGKGLCTKLVLHQIIQKANNLKIPTFVDPKGKEWEKYINATYITPNSKELEKILNHNLLNDYDFEIGGNQILSNYNINCCITTRGSDGVSVVEKNKKFHLKANAKEVFDVSGAGDTFIACFASAIVGGGSINEAADFANYAAGIVVTHMGTVAIKKDELL